MTGPLPEVAAARSAVRAELADVVPGTLVLVACSGGADSLALAAATAFVAPRAGLRAGAVVVDHGLQAGSDEVARRAAEQCRELGLDAVEVVQVDVPGSGAGGPEAAARTARYAALDATAERLGAAVVLLGHTRDDQAETVLLALARGSGARSLAGMAHRRGRLRRPFLGLPRRTTEAVCAGLGLEPWHDPTNQPAEHPTDQPAHPPARPPASGPGESGTPRRTRVRHEVLPVLQDVLGPGVPEALARTADQLREDADLLDALASEVLRSARAAASPRSAEGAGAAASAPEDLPEDLPEGLDVAVLQRAPAPLRRRALRAALVGAGVPSGSLYLSHVLAVEALVTDWHGQGPVALPGGRGVRRRCGRLTVEVAPA